MGEFSTPNPNENDRNVTSFSRTGDVYWDTQEVPEEMETHWVHHDAEENVSESIKIKEPIGELSGELPIEEPAKTAVDKEGQKNEIRVILNLLGKEVYRTITADQMSREHQDELKRARGRKKQERAVVPERTEYAVLTTLGSFLGTTVVKSCEYDDRCNHLDGIMQVPGVKSLLCFDTTLASPNSPESKEKISRMKKAVTGTGVSFRANYVPFKSETKDGYKPVSDLIPILIHITHEDAELLEVYTFYFLNVKKGLGNIPEEKIRQIRSRLTEQREKIEEKGVITRMASNIIIQLDEYLNQYQLQGNEESRRKIHELQAIREHFNTYLRGFEPKNSKFGETFRTIFRNEAA
ncbi:MAG: hypothetical protein WC437_02145 [Patescibacteria group bacterium]|jgi:hypothetical protein|nr:hypothetical protein [Patescibacteria group bacterium]